MPYETIPWLVYVVSTLLKIRGLLLWLLIVLVIDWLWILFISVKGESLMRRAGVEDKDINNIQSGINSALSKGLISIARLVIMRMLLPDAAMLHNIANWIAERLI